MAHPRLTLRDISARAVVLKLKRPVVARIATIAEWPMVLIDLTTEEGVVGRSYLEPYVVKSMRYLVPALQDLGTMLKGRRVAPAELFEAGRKRAMELLLTGETFSAERALDLGLVNRIVPHAELLTAAADLAQRIIKHSPLAVASVIASDTRGINLPIAEGLLIETEQFARVVPTHDLREGINAWMERRPASYANR